MPYHVMPRHAMPCDINYVFCTCCTYNVIFMILYYVGLPLELGPRWAVPWGGWCRRVQGPPSNWAESRRPCPGNCTSLDVYIVLHSFCADSSSLQISAIIGTFTGYVLVILQGQITVSANLHNSPQNIPNNYAETCHSPGSQNSLTMPREFRRWRARTERTRTNLENTLDKSRTMAHPGCTPFVT